jgi:hypothetical protein
MSENDIRTQMVLDIAQLGEELAATKAELAALREDAERYRWLRDGEIVCRDTDFPAAKDKAGNTLWLEELDAAIDAAKGGA